MLNKHEANATINLIYDEELHGDKRKVRRVTLQDPRRSSADIRERERIAKGKVGRGLREEQYHDAIRRSLALAMC